MVYTTTRNKLLFLDDLSLIVPPWQRIDLSSMSSIMSTLDPMALSSHCGRHFDVFFKTKPFYCSGGNILRFESLLKYLNMEWEPGNHLYKDKVSMLLIFKNHKKLLKCYWSYESLTLVIEHERVQRWG